jgi:hypothetical protein
MTHDWNEISVLLLSDSGLNNKEIIEFHYFNTNGLYAKLKALHDSVRQLVANGKAKTGALLVYGSLSDDSIQYEFNRLLDLKRVPSKAVFLLKQQIKDKIARTQSWIDSVK